MPPPCTEFQYAQIQTMLEAKIPAKEIGPLVRPAVSYLLVLKVQRNLKLWNVAKSPKLVVQGRPRKITAAMGEGLKESLHAKPSMYIDEMVWFLWDEFDCMVSERSVRRWLEQQRFSKKLIQRRAKERNQALRDYWYSRLAKWEPHQLVFLDESTANERNLDRKYGWAPIGVTPAEYLPIKRSERWSILPAYTIEGYIAWEILHGSYTQETFNKFVSDKLLPLCSPFPGPRSVLILDNASIHRSLELRIKCAEAGVLLEFLPPYSPDFNPIEKSFGGM